MPLESPLLLEVIQKLSTCRDEAAVMEVVRTAVRDLTGADGATVVLRDGDNCHYADEDAVSPLWKGKRFPMETCISGWTMMHKQQVAIPDIYIDDRIPHDAYRPTFVKSLAMTPIRRADPIGAIGAYWATHHEPSRKELATLQALGDATSTAFTNTQLISSLQEAARAKDEFLMMLAHELRNPLVPIRYAALILRSEAHDTPKAQRAHELVERQMKHMDKIVADLLDVARVTAGRLTVEKTRIDLGQVINQEASDRLAAFEVAGVGFHWDVPETPVWVEGDTTRLTQLFANLLDNAAKFTPTGGTVEVTLERGGSPTEARLSVRDTGVGIDAALLPRIFEAFAQADTTLARSSGGLGLGLSVALGIARSHGGSLHAASEGPGQGTQLTFRMPAEPEPEAVRGTPEVVGEIPANRCRILIVEDHKAAAETLRMVLELNGYDATIAHDGAAAITAARVLRPDLILSDVGLPQMDGYEMARVMRADPTTASTPIIAITGYAMPADRRRAMEAGFTGHLVKPVPPERLLAEVALALG